MQALAEIVDQKPHYAPHQTATERAPIPRTPSVNALTREDARALVDAGFMPLKRYIELFR